MSLEIDLSIRANYRDFALLASAKSLHFALPAGTKFIHHNPYGYRDGCYWVNLPENASDWADSSSCGAEESRPSEQGRVEDVVLDHRANLNFGEPRARACVVVRRALDPVWLVRFPGQTFFSTVRCKLRWGDLTECEGRW